MQPIDSKHFFLSSSQAIDDICAPLKKHFGITSFVFYKSYLDGSEIRLSNQPAWLEFYYQQQLYKVSQLEKHPDQYQSGFALWSQFNDHEKVLAPLKNFNIGNGITLSIKEETAVEFYFFGTDPKNTQAASLYLSHLEQLERFIVYFKDKAASLIQEAEKNKLFLAKSWQTQVDEKEHAGIFKQDRFDPKAFEQDTIIRNFVVDPLTVLTKREMDAARLLIAGKTSKDAGELLFISSRTIEAHWNSLKEKLHCRNKAELIEKLSGLGLRANGNFALF